MVEIIRLGENLPADLDRLVRRAAEEDVRNMTMLSNRWKSGTERFDREGEALFVALVESGIAGVGGVSRCPDVKGAMRMRRFYVVPESRRRGIAAAIALAAMRQGLSVSRELTCNARASAAAAPFWEKLGFVPADLPGITHIYRG